MPPLSFSLLKFVLNTEALWHSRNYIYVTWFAFQKSPSVSSLLNWLTKVDDKHYKIPNITLSIPMPNPRKRERRTAVQVGRGRGETHRQRRGTSGKTVTASGDVERWASVGCSDCWWVRLCLSSLSLSLSLFCDRCVLWWVSTVRFFRLSLSPVTNIIAHQALTTAITSFGSLLITLSLDFWGLVEICEFVDLEMFEVRVCWFGNLGILG